MPKGKRERWGGFGKRVRKSDAILCQNRLDSSGIGISSFADDLSHATPCPSVSHLRSVPDPSSPWAAAGGGGGGSIDKVPMPSSPLSLIGSVFGDHSHQTPSPQHNQPQQQQKQFACTSVAAPFAKPTVQVIKKGKAEFGDKLTLWYFNNVIGISNCTNQRSILCLFRPVTVR